MHSLLNKSTKEPEFDYSKASILTNYTKSSELDSVNKNKGKLNVLVRKYGNRHLEAEPNKIQVSVNSNF